MELSPDEGHSKYMYLGQIHTGLEAVGYYTKGIQVLLSTLEKQETVSEKMLKKKTTQWIMKQKVKHYFKIVWYFRHYYDHKRVLFDNTYFLFIV